ncbi:hypothetical protein AB0C42_24110 [Micromonospora taraxaci]|uniref:hypothetical protein n=1 Tax=Micromonospora taraxaci TaxID=1316803 RepID=UPI0033DCF54D
MTRAPANLLALRTLLLTHLDNAPGPDDLEPAEVGIVGDPAHRGGYHCGSDRTVANDYSVVESPRDRAGLTDLASALDVGPFSVTAGGKTHTLRTFSAWLVAQCAANAPDTRDIREVIYSPDGSAVKRWDRLGRRSTGDSSHRWHTHISYHRDAIKAGRDQTPLFRRYLTTIGLLKAPTSSTEAPDMDATQARQLGELHAIVTGWRGGMPKTPDGTSIEPVAWRLRDEAWQAKVTGLLAALSGQIGGLDTEQVLARVEALAGEERERDAALAELVRAGQSGELTAEQVLVKLRDLLPAQG